VNEIGYPTNWKEKAERIKDLAGRKCKTCKHPHDPKKGFTLTVHHLDGNKANCEDMNLAALCQRCHLVYQGTLRKTAPGQLALPW